MLAVACFSYENSLVASSNGHSQVTASVIIISSALVNIVGAFSSRNKALDIVSDSFKNIF